MILVNFKAGRGRAGRVMLSPHDDEGVLIPLDGRTQEAFAFRARAGSPLRALRKGRK